MSGGNVQRHSIPDSKLTDRAGNQVLVSKLTGKISGDAAKCENGMAERGILFWLEETVSLLCTFLMK